jgi:hypothetical protein
MQTSRFFRKKKKGEEEQKEGKEDQGEEERTRTTVRYHWELNSTKSERTGSNDYLVGQRRRRRRATNAKERKKQARLGALKNTYI